MWFVVGEVVHHVAYDYHESDWYIVSYNNVNYIVISYINIENIYYHINVYIGIVAYGT